MCEACSLPFEFRPMLHLESCDKDGMLSSSPGGSDGKASAYNAGDPGSIPGSGRSPGEGNGNPLQYSCLENPMNGGALCPWGHKESDITEWTLVSVFILIKWSEVAQLCPTLCDPMDCSLHAPPLMGFSRQGYWSGLPFPSPEDLPDPGIEPRSPAL